MSNDAAILARVVQACSGTCRICGCSGEECTLFTGDRCHWVDKLRTLCSNPDCIAKAERQKRDRQKSQRRAEREYVPAWMRAKKSGVIKRRKGKTKGWAA